MSARKQSDEDYSLDNGDLGLGEGLRPGSLPKKTTRRKNRRYPSDTGDSSSDNCLPDDIGCHDFVPPIQSKFLHFAKSHKSKKLHRRSSGSESDDMNSNKSQDSSKNTSQLTDSVEQFPTFAEIPYGTSLQQQRRLFAKDMTTIRQRCYSLDSSSQLFLSDAQFDKDGSQRNLNTDAIEKKLKEAEQEVEELKIEVETYHKRLEAKYQAIAILKNQIIKIKERDKKTKEYNHTLEKEVNQLQFELDQRSTSVEDSQQIWAVRFDNICKENVSLTSALEDRSAELKSANAQNMALMRERDELIALLDVQEQGRYVRSKSVSSSDEEYSNFSSTELAVLGACKCRGTSPEPCGCAIAAANLRREIIKLNNSVEVHKKRRDEAYMTVDAYRSAFEEQLSKNKQMMIRVAEIATAGPSKVDKAKAFIKRFIEMLNDEDYSRQVIQSRDGGIKAINGMKPLTPEIPAMTDKELVMALTEILNHRNEAFANQKLAAQLLGKRVRQLEEKLTDQQQEELA